MIYKRNGHWHLDVAIAGVRYREALNTTDKREAKELEKNRIADIKQGKGASKAGREFARKPFREAASIYLKERKPHVSERTIQFEKERLVPLIEHFGERPLRRLKAEDISEYQSARFDSGISGRTVNMETGVLRRILKRAKVWTAIAEDVKQLPEGPTRPQKSWRTSWRKLVKETARRVGREAPREALESDKSLRSAISAWNRAAAPFRGLRFHDLRHQAITEMAEAGASDATLMAVAGHMSRRMMEHYSHVRMAAKRSVLDKLESGLMGGLSAESQPAVEKVN